MTTNEVKDRYELIGFIVMLIFGAIVFFISVYSFKNITSNCASNTVRNCFTIMLMLSAALVTASITYFICKQNSDSCMRDEKSENNTATVFFGLGTMINVVLFSLSIMILLEYKKLDSSQQSACGGNNGKLYAGTILVISALSLALSIGGTVFSKGGLLARMLPREEKKKEEGMIGRRSRRGFSPFDNNDMGSDLSELLHPELL